MIYAVTADYWPNNSKKPIYYVVAKDKKTAKKKFNNTISWLKIYKVEKLSDEQVEELASKSRYEYILIQ